MDYLRGVLVKVYVDNSTVFVALLNDVILNLDIPARFLFPGKEAGNFKPFITNASDLTLLQEMISYINIKVNTFGLPETCHINYFTIIQYFPISILILYLGMHL